LNPASVESAKSWDNAANYILSASLKIAGGVVAIGAAAMFVMPYIEVLPYLIGLLLIIPIAIVVSKIKTTKRVIHENRGPGVTINKNYIQNNY
jgi:hypothetical protein